MLTQMAELKVASRNENNESNSSVVASHYNTIEEKGLSHRNNSRILHLRNFNNWIKSMQIKEYLNIIADSKPYGSAIRVLDMGCGKGGDLLKWRQGRIKHLICVDIAEISIEDCKKRYNDTRQRSNNLFSAEFIVADLTKERIRSKFEDPTVVLDLVSCQFAFHYCFESLGQARCMLKNSSECLRKGGYFIATIPNAYDIVKRLKCSDENAFGNEVFKITFDDKLDSIPLFGAKYNFQLEGVVDCPEFLVHLPTLIKLAKQFNLKFKKALSFEEYFNGHIRSGKFLLNKMSALETYPSVGDAKLSGKTEDYREAEKFIQKNKDAKYVGTLSLPEWEAVSLYMVIVFEKI